MKSYHGIIDVFAAFKLGDQPPTGYNAMIEWADVQMEAGLKQKKCGFCSRWCFPQELSGEEIQIKAQTSRGLKVNLVSPICNECKQFRGRMTK